MKYCKLSLFLILCFLSFLGKSQDKDYYPWFPPEWYMSFIDAKYLGIETGINLTKFYYTDKQVNMLPEQMALQPHIGAYLRFKTPHKIGFELKAAYEGFKHDMPCFIDYSFAASYLSIELPANYHLYNNNRFSVFLLLGPYLSTPVSGKIQYGANTLPIGKNSVSPVDLGILGGTCFRFLLKKGDASICIQYSYHQSLANSYSTNEMKGTATALKMPNYSISGNRLPIKHQFTVGLDLHLFDKTKEGVNLTRVQQIHYHPKPN